VISFGRSVQVSAIAQWLPKRSVTFMRRR
jgi:hypothetical protein